jgi:hypothetical protein
MTRETNTLANAVMNAFWHPEAFTPTEDCPEELNAAKLAREYVISSVIHYIISLLIRSIIQFLVSLHQRLWTGRPITFQGNHEFVL